MPGAAHTARVALPPERTAPGTARRFLTDTLRRWHLDEPVDTACLLTTELVTNAVLHAGTPVEVILETHDRTLRVEVVDGVGCVPRQRVSGSEPLSITGRGLGLVRALSHTWGVTPRDDGKSVWFELPLAQSA